MAYNIPDLPEKSIIIVDTSALSYSGNNWWKKLVSGHLEEFVKNGHTLAVSDITVGEMLSGVPKAKSDEIVEVLGSLKQYDVTKPVIYVASQLQGIYSTKVTLPDRIIAATSVLTGSFLITGNAKDFPKPYFTRIWELKILKTVNSKDQEISVCLLKPDQKIISERFDNRS